LIPAFGISEDQTDVLSTIRGIVLSPRWSGSLTVGLIILALVLLFGAIGPFFVDPKNADVASVLPSQPPSSDALLGTDSQGRDVLSIMVVGTPQTLRIGLTAGIVGLAIGLTLGLVSGFFGGLADVVIRVISDSLLTVPGIAILVIIAASVGHMTIELMGLTVAALAWMHPTRAIRAQVLSIRERPYVQIARANGENEFGVLFREVMPNLLPYVAASFVGAVSGAILASVGLEALGLGPNDSTTLGTTIYWSEQFAAIMRGQWWWWAPPIVMIALIFVGLFLVSVGLDRFANPRLRQRT
jgi:peptide/nickel transport system permease protein